MGIGGSSTDLSAPPLKWRRSDVLAINNASGAASAAAEEEEEEERRRKLHLRIKERRMRRRTRRAQRRSACALEPKQPWSKDSVRPLPPVVKEEDEEGEECPGLEPFFFDEAEAVAEHEKRTRREQEAKRLLQREKAVRSKIRVYDPKRGRIWYTRINFVDLGKFDLDEESPLGPMRCTDAAIDMLDDLIFKERKEQFLPGGDESASVNLKTRSSDVDELCKPAKIIFAKSGSSKLFFRLFRKDSANVFSVKTDPSDDPGFLTSDVGEELFFPCDSANFLSMKIVSSDVGFPINVYGTVIARDMLDRKCVYLFRCDRDHSHLILTKEEQLIFTGPKRGLALIDSIYIEFDLKIKGAGKQKKDKQLSKGFIELKAVSCSFKDIEIESYHFESMLSEVVLMYAVEKYAVEATITIEVVQGKFCGDITARTTNIRDNLVLYDSKLMSAEMTGKGVIPLLRRVVAVGLKGKMLVTIARAGVCKADRERTIKFTPSVNGRDEAEVTCGSVKMFVKVAWSIICRHRFNGR